MSIFLKISHSIRYLVLASLYLGLSIGSAETSSNFELLSRSGLIEGHQLPARHFVNNPKQKIDDQGNVYFVTTEPGTLQNVLWKKQGQDLKILYISEVNQNLSDFDIAPTGSVYVMPYDQAGGRGVFQLTDQDPIQILGPSLYHRDWILATPTGFIFRQSDQSLFRYANGLENTVISTDEDLSYLFAPTLSDNGDLFVKARFGGHLGNNAPDKIIKISQGKKSTILEDRDANPSSTWKSIRNLITSTPKGIIYAIAQDEKGFDHLLKITNEGTESLLNTGEKQISSFSYFNVSANDANQVVFRAKSTAGIEGLYLLEGKSLKLIIQENQELMTDLEMGIISNGSGPAFSGAPVINARGEIVFFVTLRYSRNPEVFLGQALYKYRPN